MRMLKKILFGSLLIGSLLMVGCGKADLDKAEELANENISNIIENNLNECKQEGYNLKNNKIYYDMLKYIDLSTIDTNIEELEDVYKMTLIFNYKDSSITSSSSYEKFTLYINKDIDINNIDLKNENVKVVECSSYIQGEFKSGYFAKGYNNITENDYEKHMYVENDEVVMKEMFLRTICDIDELLK